MPELGELRQQIDQIDSQIFSLFAERARVSERVAAYKREHGLRVFDPARERQKVASAAAAAPEDLATYAQVLMELLMEASRSRQHALLGDVEKDPVLARIDAARASTPELFPRSARVCCQGVEGAYSQMAAEKFFRRPQIAYAPSFDAVFRTVEQGLAEFGVLPLENSTAGSVNQMFDLMVEHSFYVVRTTRVKVEHNLLARRGATIEGIRDIYSHEQAIGQCAEFLSGLPDVRVHVCENTAVAAKRVAESGRTDVAALSSRSCADLYDLDVLVADAQDHDNNYTRFACISRDLRIYPGADRTSLMIVLPHEPGTLYKLLAKFYALDINLLKLESRPIPERDFEFRFYFDIECPVAAPEFSALMSSIGSLCQECRYLGSYAEVI
ncbi:bifunctional chorismate mutase/prephenate dehydratase [Olsenella sp. An285]|uniref:bifunctional chorismate mutase/prephenate dehydratase n=1 Tax=Olsenella sp. An285 TaxID=1965621 RepID=UPI000B376060|nr:bifunctional chorismate mutase/prephenate dehydratase [Olsenella sp. An285]OUO46405.1 bifunctional chorismate mutase/prephenate dehydratase [Olsenella sp. An285]